MSYHRDQWLGSRAIAAEKAYTANGPSLEQSVLSTANLYAGSQPGGVIVFGVGPDKNDEIIYDIGADGKSASGFGHPKCKGKEAKIAREIGAGYVAPR